MRAFQKTSGARLFFQMAPVQDRIPLNAEGNRENRSLLAEARTIGRKRDAHGRMKMGTLISKQLFHGWSVGEQGDIPPAFFVQFDNKWFISYDQRLLLLIVTQATPRKLSNGVINR